ncbi:hypothetical protein V8E53_001330 [Lactarius tabidus]
MRESKPEWGYRDVKVPVAHKDVHPHVDCYLQPSMLAKQLVCKQLHNLPPQISPGAHKVGSNLDKHIYRVLGVVVVWWTMRLVKYVVLGKVGRSLARICALGMQQVEQQYEEITEGREGHAIPRNLTKRQRLMLWTDVEGGVIKCKLCPTVEFSSWQCFRRHCDISEDHPAELTFCDRCGDYFGRRDSERRHKRTRKYQGEWRTTPRDQAKRKKMVKWLFENFNARMKYCLRTGEELGPLFATMIAQAKVPT